MASSPPPTGRPLPPYVSDLVQDAFLNFKRLFKAAQAKKKALERLKTTMPKSLATKTQVQVSKALQASDPAAYASVMTNWQDLKEAHEKAQHAIILNVCEAEVKTLEEAIKTVQPDMIKAVDSYLVVVNSHAASRPPVMGITTTVPRGGGSWTPQSGEVQSNANLLLSELISEFLYVQAHADAAKQVKAEAAKAARLAAEEMEVDTSNDILVGALVKREIAKTTAALRKEVNQLRQALNSQAGRKNKGATGPKPPTAGAKAKEPRGDAANKQRAKPKGNAHGKPPAESKPARAAQPPQTKPKNPKSKKSNSTDKQRSK